MEKKDKSYEEYLIGLVSQMSMFILDRFSDFFDSQDDVIIYFSGLSDFKEE